MSGKEETCTTPVADEDDDGDDDDDDRLENDECVLVTPPKWHVKDEVYGTWQLKMHCARDDAHRCIYIYIDR